MIFCNFETLVPFFCILISHVNSAPAPTKPPEETPPPPPLPEGDDGNNNNEAPNTGLYYDQYLQKVVKLLESDENFRKTMETANFEDIRDGKLSSEIYKIPNEIKKQLDDAKKEEINRLRRMAHAKMKLDKGEKIRNSNSLKDIANHLDADNAHSFEAQDLTNLIKAATKDLENFDEKRHEDFKRYEMTKDLRRQEKLKAMNEEDRRKAEREYQEMKKRHDDHPALNHPGSKAQMEEVWDEEDGLKGQAFNPKTFFRLHDLNSDNALDPMELEALFEKDLSKVYDAANPEDDMMEMEEERRRMRKHVMKEVDYDRNGLITFEEFMMYTKRDEFNKPDQNSYKTVDQMIDSDEVYTKEELSEFRDMITEQENDVKEKLKDLRQQAQSVVSMKSELYKKEKEMGPYPEEHEQAELEEKQVKVQAEEKILKEMHEDLKEQSKEILEMKEELRKQETAHQFQEGQAQPPQDGDKQPFDPPSMDGERVEPGFQEQPFVQHMEQDPPLQQEGQAQHVQDGDYQPFDPHSMDGERVEPGFQEQPFVQHVEQDPSFQQEGQAQPLHGDNQPFHPPSMDGEIDEPAFQEQPSVQHMEQDPSVQQ